MYVGKQFPTYSHKFTWPQSFGLLSVQTLQTIVHTPPIENNETFYERNIFACPTIRQWPGNFNPLNAELIPICHLLALLGVHHFLHVSRIRVKSLTLRLLMSYTYIHTYIHIYIHTHTHTHTHIYIYDISSLRVKMVPKSITRRLQVCIDSGERHFGHFLKWVLTW